MQRLRRKIILSVIAASCLLTIGMGNSGLTSLSNESLQKHLEMMLASNQTLRDAIERSNETLAFLKSNPVIPTSDQQDGAKVIDLNPDLVNPDAISIHPSLEKELQSLRSQLNEYPVEDIPYEDLINARIELLIGKAIEYEAGQEVTRTGFPVSSIETVRSLSEQLRPSVLLFESESQMVDGIGQGGTATAFLIAPDLAVTNSHNVRDDNEQLRGVFTLRTYHGEEIRATLIDDDIQYDIALLRLKTPLDYSPLKWGSSISLNVGDPVFTIGNPGMMGSWITMVGTYTENSSMGLLDKNGVYQETEVLEFSLKCMKGCSGSPIFNMNGEVIAVLFGASSPDNAEDTLDLEVHTKIKFRDEEMTQASSSDIASKLVESFLLPGGGS